MAKKLTDEQREKLDDLLSVAYEHEIVQTKRFLAFIFLLRWLSSYNVMLNRVNANNSGCIELSPSQCCVLNFALTDANELILAIQSTEYEAFCDYGFHSAHINKNGLSLFSKEILLANKNAMPALAIHIPFGSSNSWITSKIDDLNIDAVYFIEMNYDSDRNIWQIAQVHNKRIPVVTKRAGLQAVTQRRQSFL